MFAHAGRGLEIVGGVLREVRLGGDCNQLVAPLARADRTTSLDILPPCPLVGHAGMQCPPGRREDYAKSGYAALDQPDIDGVIVAAADELLGAVERIDQEIDIAMRGDAARGDLLLGDYRNAWRGSRECGEENQLRGAIGL